MLAVLSLVAAQRIPSVLRSEVRHITRGGRTPSSAPDPWSGISITRETAADEGVGPRTRGSAPLREFFNELPTQDTLDGWPKADTVFQLNITS